MTANVAAHPLAVIGGVPHISTSGCYDWVPQRSRIAAMTISRSGSWRSGARATRYSPIPGPARRSGRYILHAFDRPQRGEMSELTGNWSSYAASRLQKDHRRKQ